MKNAPKLEQKLMIDFNGHRAWCFVCNEWVSSDSLYIDGTHGNSELKSSHTIWGDML